MKKAVGDQLEHIREAMRRGKTREGVAAVIERGKAIQSILDAEE